MDPSDEDHKTPPLGIFADHRVQDFFDRIVKRIDDVSATERRIRADDVKTLHDRCHKLANGVEVLKNQAIEHHAVDEGKFEAVEARFGTQEEKMQSIQAAVQEIRIAAQKSADSSGNWWKWAIGQAVAVLILVIGAWFLLDRRVTTTEIRLENTSDDVGDVDTKLDRMDEKLDRIEDRISDRAAAPVVP